METTPMALKPPTTRLLPGHTGPVFTLGWSVDGGKLASGSKDEGIRIWNPEQADYGKASAELKGHSSLPPLTDVLPARHSPDAPIVAIGDSKDVCPESNCLERPEDERARPAHDPERLSCQPAHAPALQSGQFASTAWPIPNPHGMHQPGLGILDARGGRSMGRVGLPQLGWDRCEISFEINRSARLGPL
ncbi:hypothetical protein PtA15_2A264 [Puccinia triticina]|uniref:Anaphase-promoting complex subunit 4 WD40 domain-containing protein n=1 Tax=Puccinia triticina TaxID=208348 RepID=A0ABY7C9U5_9BASI|nr:uncharacterized protein PtA15_2A264 [Puccinia triticina]WAQ81951.1 hypothetical protein PtA15_2A264 [Puccinia triticina]